MKRKPETPESNEPALVPGLWLHEAEQLRQIVANIEELRQHIADVNPRPPGWLNDLLQIPKNLLARSLGWYTRSLQRFNTAVSRSLHELFHTVETLSTNMVALEWRLNQSEQAMSAIRQSLLEQLETLQQQVGTFLNQQRKASAELAGGVAGNGVRNGDDFRIATFRSSGEGKTLYVVGLFGTGRLYVDDLIVGNIGKRSRYFRDQIRLHPGPTPMIYSGHVTLRHTSRAQSLPIIMRGISESIRSGFADSVFVYRHPIDSLLTNWVWWRTYLREDRVVAGITEVYHDPDALCADLERNFPDFLSFAAGDPDFFAPAPGPSFLSFAQFVEETELHRQAATLSVRLEDFSIDARKQFAKIADVMSVDLDPGRLCLPPPKTQPYRHLEVMKQSRCFRNFVHGLDKDIRRRTENVGFQLHSLAS
jgi:hypothetical protein